MFSQNISTRIGSMLAFSKIYKSNQLSSISSIMGVNQINYRHNSTTVTAPLKVVITGAAGQIGSYILQLISSGRLSSHNRKVEINMLDIDGVEKIMHGIRMEIEDCSYPSLHRVNVFTKSDDAFKDIDCAVLLANKMTLTADIKRVDLLSANKDLYTEIGEQFQKYSKPDALAVMVANPCNTNCLIMMKNAPKRSPKSFASLSRLDHNRLVSTTARKLNVPNDLIRKCIVWGNHSHSMHPDIRFAEFKPDYSSYSSFENVKSTVNDPKWAEEILLWQIKDRAYEVLRNRGKSSSLSAANAATDHLRDWVNGTPDGDWVSMGVYSDGTKYGLPSGIFYSMPVVCYDKKYTIVDDLPIDDDTREKLMITAEELLDEKKLAGLE